MSTQFDFSTPATAASGNKGPRGAYDAPEPRQHSSQPIVTGTSVLALKFKDGVAVAADTVAFYGSMSRFRGITRLYKAGPQVVVGASGDMADYVAVKELLQSLDIANTEADDGMHLTPKAVYTFLTRVMYNRRSKMDPLWNTVVVGGIQDDKPFLGVTDKLGVAYVEDTIATGYGAYIALPLLRSAYERNPAMTREEAVAALEECIKVLFYRDARSDDKFEIALVTAAGVEILPAKQAKTDWSISSMVNGYE